MPGSLLSQIYTDRFADDGLAAAAADTARDPIGGTVGVTARIGNSALVTDAQAAYTDGMQIVCAVIVVIGAILTVMSHARAHP